MDLGKRIRVLEVELEPEAPTPGSVPIEPNPQKQPVTVPE